MSHGPKVVPLDFSQHWSTPSSLHVSNSEAIIAEFSAPTGAMCSETEYGTRSWRSL